jgi:D-glycero-alpha-D-manno-heptose-7-phosphate kinase
MASCGVKEERRGRDRGTVCSEERGNVIWRSRAPLRLGFAGGGTDVAPYPEERGGAVLNAAISRYACVSLEESTGRDAEIVSLDYGLRLSVSIEDSIMLDGQLDLVKGVINRFRGTYGLDHGFRLTLRNDAPPGSGLGSSSSMAVALVQAFADWMRVPLGITEVAELALGIERDDVGIMGGKQDQYAAAYGGVNFLEFSGSRTVVNPLRVGRNAMNELESGIILGYLGLTRQSAQVIEAQMANYREGRAETIEALDHIKELAYACKNALLCGTLEEFGRLVHEEWQQKRRLASGITNEAIDRVYGHALDAGAWGGKISGAGGGGFMFFIVDPDRRPSVVRALQGDGVVSEPFSFTDHGVEGWRVTHA